MVKPTKLKTKAQLDVPQTRDAVASAIHEIGVAQRDILRIKLDIEDVTSNLTKEHQPTIDALNERIANLITGEVNWRQRPPSVKTRASAALFEKLKRLGFSWMIRSKEELDKEAILAKPETAAAAGIEIATGVEDFVIVPFEQDIAA